MTTVSNVSAEDRRRRLMELRQQGAIKPSPAALRTLYTVEPARIMRAPGFDWEHEIRVALPPSYAHTDDDYPVLWVTDNALEAAIGAAESLAISGKAPELILVSVGLITGDDGLSEEFARRRSYDFCPGSGEMFFAGPQGESLRAQASARFPAIEEWKAGGAQTFLDFLVGDVRGALASEYRMDPNDHGIIGGSGGGMFVGFALFARPGAFMRYISASPSLNSTNFRIFEMEEEYAAGHDDLPAHVFFCAGDAEMFEDYIAAWGCVSSMARMVETLHLRKYPSLKLSARIYPGETHGTIGPYMFRDGIPAVWSSKAPVASDT